MARGSSTAFRKTALAVVQRDGQICGICGHAGAITVDHIIPHRDWPKNELGQAIDGFDHPDNLRAAHGSRGVGEHNPCRECDPQKWPQGRHCNQSRGAGDTINANLEPHSRSW
jgi:5-methylcytosine-specific restriction endonuclease McrA